MARKDQKTPGASTAPGSNPIHLATYQDVKKMHRFYFDIVTKRYIWFAISLLILIPGIISLAVQGLKMGIDFTGGDMLEMTFKSAVTQTAITDTLKSVGLTGQVQMSNGDTTALIRTEALDDAQRTKLVSTLQDKVGAIDTSTLKEDNVGPAMGVELEQNALKALGIACLLMIGYISIRFKFNYAISGIIALLHDVLIVLGVFSIFQIEIDATFVAAILTVFGYSINDTVVIFDRIRENEGRMKKSDDLEDMVDKSIWQTMRRSICTVVTVLIALLAIFIFGGESTKIFSLAMLIGVFCGAYSSIFIASQVWVEIKKHSKPKSKRLAKA